MSPLTHSFHTKRRFAVAARFLCAALALLLVATFVPPVEAQAVTQKEIQALKDKQAQIANSKSSIQQKINEVKNDKEQAMARKQLIEQEIEVILQELDVTNSLIAQLDQQILDKTAELQAAQAEEARYTDRFLKRVRNMEEQGEVSYWAVMFSSASFSDLLDNMNVITEIVEYDQGVMDELERIKLTIAAVKKELESALADQESARTQLEASNAELQRQRQEVDALAAQLRAAEEEYQTQLHAIEMSATELDKQVKAAEAQYASQLTNQSGNATLTGNGGFIWPLPAGVNRITSPYGYRNCPFHGREFHSGVDVSANSGTNIYAAKGGTVIISTYHNSYGNYVVLAHPDGSRTLYAHMKQRACSVGQTVNQGQIIGYVGTTGSSTGNHLHFEVWRGSNSSTRTNPMSFFS